MFLNEKAAFEKALFGRDFTLRGLEHLHLHWGLCCLRCCKSSQSCICGLALNLVKVSGKMLGWLEVKEPWETLVCLVYLVPWQIRCAGSRKQFILRAEKCAKGWPCVTITEVSLDKNPSFVLFSSFISTFCFHGPHITNTRWRAEAKLYHGSLGWEGGIYSPYCWVLWVLEQILSWTVRFESISNLHFH